jgi:hypothetical protein
MCSGDATESEREAVVIVPNLFQTPTGDCPRLQVFVWGVSRYVHAVYIYYIYNCPTPQSPAFAFFRRWVLRRRAVEFNGQRLFEKRSPVRIYPSVARAMQRRTSIRGTWSH